MFLMTSMIQLGLWKIVAVQTLLQLYIKTGLKPGLHIVVRVAEHASGDVSKRI